MDDSDYERGCCQDCRAAIQPYGPSSRCAVCTDKHEAYIESLWGLDGVIRERLKYEALGLCFHCGTGLEEGDGRLCATCAERSDHGRWCSEINRRGGGKRTFEENPYKSTWDCDEVDNSSYLTPTLGTLSDRMSTKSRVFRCKAERGGPRGRAYAMDAITFMRIARKLRASFLDIRKYK